MSGQQEDRGIAGVGIMVAAFTREGIGEEALEALKEARSQGKIYFEDAAVIRQDIGGEVHYHETGDVTRGDLVPADPVAMGDLVAPDKVAAADLNITADVGPAPGVNARLHLFTLRFRKLGQRIRCLEALAPSLAT